MFFKLSTSLNAGIFVHKDLSSLNVSIHNEI